MRPGCRRFKPCVLGWPVTGAPGGPSGRQGRTLARSTTSYFFFFKGSAAPRDLPSSPPRRSSDLTLIRALPIHVHARNRLAGFTFFPPARHRCPVSRLPAQGKVGDVDLVLTQNRAYTANNTRYD